MHSCKFVLYDRINTCAEEGDLRLANEKSNENWVFGNLQLFLEGSWGQVCNTNFAAEDATVACRQLGFGAGTIVAQDRRNIDNVPDFANVFPEVALVGSSCTGDEARLVDCGATIQGPNDDPLDYFDPFDLEFDCQNAASSGLVLACVKRVLTGNDAGVLTT